MLAELRRTIGTAGAEDVVQTVALRALSRDSPFESAASLTDWAAHEADELATKHRRAGRRFVPMPEAQEVWAALEDVEQSVVYRQAMAETRAVLAGATPEDVAALKYALAPHPEDVDLTTRTRQAARLQRLRAKLRGSVRNFPVAVLCRWNHWTRRYHIAPGELGQLLGGAGLVIATLSTPAAAMLNSPEPVPLRLHAPTAQNNPASRLDAQGAPQKSEHSLLAKADRRRGTGAEPVVAPTAMRTAVLEVSPPGGGQKAWVTDGDDDRPLLCVDSGATGSACVPDATRPAREFIDELAER